MSFFIILFSGIRLIAQPLLCTTAEMTPICETACVICDIDGFSGVNNNTQTGVAPPDFCTTEWHNINWIAFVAGTENITLRVAVGSCQINWGLEIGIYESINCENPSQVSFCNTDIQPNSAAVFSNTIPLTVGQYYYFVMDGSNGDICNYTIEVTEGSTVVGELEPINEIQGPETACLGETQTFEVPELLGANFMEWSIDGNSFFQGDNIFEHTWTNPGTFEICYDAFNVCDAIPTICKTVQVEPLPDIIYMEEICSDGCFYLPEKDTFLCSSGSYSFLEMNELGCPYNINVELSLSPPVFTPLELEFCFGDSIIIAGQAFTSTGNYDISVPGSLACDSIVQLDLTTFLCDIDGGFADDNLDCHGSDSGTLFFNLLDGVFPYNYEWEEVNGSGLTGMGISNDTDGSIQINGLPSGIYSITITDASGSVGIFVGQIFEPTPMNVITNISDYNNFNTACPNSMDGNINLIVEGGTPPYSFLWEDGSTALELDSIPGGIHTTTITDANGCILIQSTELVSPDEMMVSTNITHPGCNPENSGIVTLEIQGGTSPYIYSMDNGTPSVDSIFDELLPGGYSFGITDFNGCTSSIQTMLQEPNALQLDLEDEILVLLGDSVQIIPSTNTGNITYEWQGGTGLSCTDCPAPFVTPLETDIYTLTGTMGNGCTQTDSILIRVDKQRHVFVPNIFSPNGDGFNDLLSVFAGNEVTKINTFHVYSRWGEQVYSQDDFLPNQPLIGWDGRFRGKKMNPNVFIWVMEVVFIDGVIQTYSGDVVLAR